MTLNGGGSISSRVEYIELLGLTGYTLSMEKFILGTHLVGVIVAVLYGGAAVLQIATKRGNARLSRVMAVGLGIYQTATGALLILLAPGTSVQAVCVKGLGMIVVLAILQTSLEYRLKPATETPTVVN